MKSTMAILLALSIHTSAQAYSDADRSPYLDQTAETFMTEDDLNIEKDSIFDHLELEVGEVVTGVDSSDAPSPAEAMRAYQRLKDNESLIRAQQEAEDTLQR